MKYTPENIDKLAEDVLDGWDMKTLMRTMKARLIMDYTEDEELFHADVELQGLEEASNG